MAQLLPDNVELSDAPPGSLLDESTLDEPIWRTIWRDVVTIAKNLRAVLIPINWQFSGRERALANWDLWGPLVRLPSGI